MRQVKEGSSACRVRNPPGWHPPGPDFMPEGPGFFTGDPLGVTLGSGNATVQSGGALKNNKRGMMPDIPEKILDQSFRLDLKQPARHIHAVLGQKFKSAGSLWIGIRAGRHHPPDPGSQNFMGTGRGFTEMIAGFQGNEQIRPSGGIAGMIDGHHFRMISTKCPVPAFSYHLTVLDHHGPDTRVRGGKPLAPGRQGQGQLHMPPIRHPLYPISGPGHGRPWAAAL